jgi:hypothetical protein
MSLPCAPLPVEGLPPLPPQETLRRRRQALAELGPRRLAQLEALAPDLEQRQTDAARQAIEQPRSNRSRLGVALKLVDEFAHAVEPLAACRRGCAHCCCIRVEMTELEAERLGAAIGRTPNKRLRYLPAQAEAYGYATPCPFPAGGECSIYEHRPFACRKHHSVDIDDLFCHLDVPAEFAASVPQVNPNLALVVWGSAISSSMGVTDLRDWFPGERELARGPVGRIGTARELLDAAGA